MLRSSRWAAVLFTLLGAAGQAAAAPADQPQRMPVGPPDPAGAAPAILHPTAPAVAAPAPLPAASGPALVPPDYSIPPPINAAPQQPAPAVRGASTRTDARAGQAPPKARRWHLFRRRSNDARPSGR
jgi:hypothetical protein